MARSTAQIYTALSAALPVNARAHVMPVMEETAARVPARALLLQTPRKMAATALSTASTAGLLTEQPGRARARAHPGIKV